MTSENEETAKSVIEVWEVKRILDYVLKICFIVIYAISLMAVGHLLYFKPDNFYHLIC